MMNLPHIGQRFSENLGIFTPYRGGQIEIDHIEKNYALLSNGRKVWILPDGRLIALRLDPFARYFQVLDYYVHHRLGSVTISGRYPNFFTDQGVRVWLDADGIMKPFDPGPIAERVQLKNRVAQIARRSGRAIRIEAECECQQCGKPFKPTRRTARFCCRTCQNRANYLKRV